MKMGWIPPYTCCCLSDIFKPEEYKFHCKMKYQVKLKVSPLHGIS